MQLSQSHFIRLSAGDFWLRRVMPPVANAQKQAAEALEDDGLWPWRVTILPLIHFGM